jgi:outer membrane lipoprotein SlyB
MTDASTGRSHDKAGGKRNGILYAILLIAAISVIIFSMIGIATMTGIVPRALSDMEHVAPGGAVEPAQRAVPDARTAQGRRRAASGGATSNAPCANCGVVESIRIVEVQGEPGPLGAVAGGLVGGIVGSQIGGGRGRTAMTVVGAGAGAYAGHEIEKNMNTSSRYQIRVRMDDGTYRTFHERSQPVLVVGQSVRVTENGVVAAEQVAGHR